MVAKIVMRNTGGGHDLWYFAISQFLQLFDSQASDKFHLYTGYAKGSPLSLHDSNIVVDYLLPSPFRNKLF